MDDHEEEPQFKVVIPTDTRPAVQAETAPPPITGGTLLVTRDGASAVMSDVAGDRVVVADIATRTLRGSIALEPGDEPGRLVEDAAGRVHVALRKGGAIASLDLTALEVSERRDVCSAPRGVAFDAPADELHVACVSGKFVSLPTTGVEGMRSVQLPNDLRDVVVTSAGIWVSRFRSAEVLRLNASGEILATLRPPTVDRVGVNQPTFDGSDGEPMPVTLEDERVRAPFEPTVAWRLQAAGDGGVVMVHQRSTTEEINLDVEPTENNISSSPYGGGSAAPFDCHGIVRSSATHFSSAGIVTPGADYPGVLPVDMAVNPSTAQVVVVQAGKRDFEAPQPEIVSRGSDSDQGDVAFGGLPDFASGSAQFLQSPQTTSPEQECQFPEPAKFEGAEDGTPVAVAFANQALLVQTRYPSTLQFVNGGVAETTISLGGDEQRDTGFDIFHQDAGAGVSCASCHPEGSDDGHVWRFSGQGMRRTQAVDVGLSGTAPFHWDATLPDVGALMNEVFVGRMGGVHQSEGRLSVLQDWVFQLQAPRAETPLDQNSVDRGRDLFRSAEVGCASCHAGQKLTDNKSYAVGTRDDGALLQVPSLVGISTRSTLMHNGCISTLEERFTDPCAGGDAHGIVSGLSETDVADIVAYLKTL